MDQFPKLKTGAVAQYPATLEQRFSTEVNRFLDCSEQRYRNLPGSRRRWVIALDMLDETETATLVRFFEQQQGRLGVFQFPDPWTGNVVQPCRFGEDSFPMQEESESRCALKLTVEEVPA